MQHKNTRLTVAIERRRSPPATLAGWLAAGLRAALVRSEGRVLSEGRRFDPEAVSGRIGE